jgi:hypothetical protein
MGGLLKPYFSIASKLSSQKGCLLKPSQQFRKAESLCFLLLICLQKLAFDTASKQKTPSFL